MSTPLLGAHQPHGNHRDESQRGILHRLRQAVLLPAQVGELFGVPAEGYLALGTAKQRQLARMRTLQIAAALRDARLEPLECRPACVGDRLLPQAFSDGVVLIDQEPPRRSSSSAVVVFSALLATLLCLYHRRSSVQASVITWSISKVDDEENLSAQEVEDWPGCTSCGDDDVSSADGLAVTWPWLQSSPRRRASI